MKWSWKGISHDYHILHSNTSNYAILFSGAKGRGSIERTMRSVYFIGICQEGEFRFEGGTLESNVYRHVDGKNALVASWKNPIVEFIDKTRFLRKEQGIALAKTVHFIQDFRSMASYINEEENEQIRFESEGFNPKLWLNRNADVTHLPVLVLFSGCLQLMKAEEEAIWSP